MTTSRRRFVAAGTAAAMAAVKLEALAIDGGPKTVTLPAERQTAITKWPAYGPEEKRVVMELLENNRFYQEIPLLEKETAAHTGSPFAKAHCNGTSALMSAFFAMDLPAGSEVLVPSYTASASIVPMRFFGLVPVFDVVFSWVTGRNVLSLVEFAAFCLLVPGAILISYRKENFSLKHVGTKVLASFLFSLDYLVCSTAAKLATCPTNLCGNGIGQAG